jgi:membrane protein DedA with SNARE-associated domain
MHTLMTLLHHYGYAAIFLLVMVEDFGVPAPGETALVVGSAAAATGQLNIWGVLVAAFLGAVIGDNIGFAIGHFGGRKLVLSAGGRVGITHSRLEYAEGFFHKYGDVVVAGARFVEVLRQLNGIIAGTMGMDWRKFLAFNALGAALWVSVWGAIGYFAGENWRAIGRWFLRFSWLALALFALAVIAWVIYQRSHAIPNAGAIDTDDGTIASGATEESTTGDANALRASDDAHDDSPADSGSTPTDAT